MQNVEMTREDRFLVIRIDLSRDFGPSASGKTIIIASSRGNARIPGEDEAYIGINCFRRVRAGRRTQAAS